MCEYQVGLRRKSLVGYYTKLSLLASGNNPIDLDSTFYCSTTLWNKDNNSFLFYL